jgi:hypothetical protein
MSYTPAEQQQILEDAKKVVDVLKKAVDLFKDNTPLTDEEKDAVNKKLIEDCVSPEHSPPMHRVYEVGTHEHVCPSCRQVTKFFVPMVRC